MADASSGDILMYFVQKAGATALAAESIANLVTGDKLTADFKAGHFFEVENFNFSIALADDEGGGPPGGDQRSYSRWRALKETTAKPTPPFQAEPQDVSITRRIDSSSPVLLQHCLETHRFDKAVLVKRSRTGTQGHLSGFLRMEFEKVWVKAIEWEDGDTVKETCKFKYAALKVTYVKRKPDGNPASTWPCSWTALSNG